MKGLFERFGPWVAATLAFTLMAEAAIRGCAPTPKPIILQRAAQDAASAIVAVEHADTALARHVTDSTRLAELTVKYRADSITRVSLQRRLALTERNLPATPDLVDGALASPTELVARWKARADTAVVALVLADSVIAQDSVTVHELAGANDSLRRDNAGLASSLVATKSELATHRTVVIPASAMSSGVHLPNLLKLFNVTVGYGAQYNVSAKRVTFGPQITFGVRIPL